MSTIPPALPGAERSSPVAPGGRQAVKDLAASLQAGDLGAAKQAYVQLVKNAPDGATWNPESAFAQLGRALKAGDLAAAKEAAKAAWQDFRQATPPVIPGVPEPAPAPSTTGGTAGTLLNVVA